MDPYFDVAIADVRGFDLGDDAELLADLHSRRVTSPASLSTDDWMLLGVLSHRAGAPEDAQHCLDKAARDEDLPGLARYLQSQMRLSQGRLAEAAALLEMAEAAVGDSLSVPAADLLHARGSIARAQGDVAEATTLYRRAMGSAPTAPRALVLARVLAAQSKADAALAATAVACRLEPMRPATLLAAAEIETDLGAHERAAEHLNAILDLDPTQLEHIAARPTFANLDPGSPITAVLAPADRDYGWLEGFDDWLDELRADPELAGLDLRWLDEAESLEKTEALVASFADRGPLGTLHTEATLSLCKELLHGRRVVARGPCSPSRIGKTEFSWLLIDARDPTTLLLAPSFQTPPFLWIDIGTTRERLEAGLATLRCPPGLDRIRMRGRARGFMGYRLRFGVPSPYTAGAVPANALELDQHFALSPFLEPGSWGSAYADDPWPDAIPEQPDMMLKFSDRQKRVSAQAPGSVWSVTHRTLYSRSYIGIELHHRDIFAFDIRYQPAPHAAVVERVNAHFGCDYPTDLPLDVVAAILGFGFDAATELLSQLESTADPDEIAALLTVLSALRHDDLSATRVYRRYMDHPDPVVRATLCNIFSAYNHESMLEEMCALETDDELREQLEAILDEGIPVTELDPYSDYELTEGEEFEAAEGQE